MVMRTITGLVVLTFLLTAVGILGGSVRHLMGSTTLDVLVGLGLVTMGFNTYFVATFIVVDQSQKNKESAS